MGSSLPRESGSWRIARALSRDLPLPICFWFDLLKKQLPQVPQLPEITLDDLTLWKEEMWDPSPAGQISTENRARLEWVTVRAQHLGNLNKRKGAWRTVNAFLLKLHVCFMEQRNRCRPCREPFTELYTSVFSFSEYRWLRRPPHLICVVA